MIYLLPLICFAAAAAFVLLRQRHSGAAVPKAFWLEAVRDLAAVYVLIGGTSALVGTLARGTVPAAAVAVISLLTAGWMLLRHIRPDAPSTALVRDTAIAAAVILVIECCGMNWESFGKQTLMPVPLDTVSHTGDAALTDGALVLTSETTLTLEDVPADARYVLADVAVEQDHLPTLLRLRMKDDDFTTQYQDVQVRWAPTGQTVLAFSPYGRARALELRISDLDGTVTLSGLTLAAKRPFAFSLVRTGTLLLVFLVLCAVRRLGLERVPYRPHDKGQLLCIVGTIGLCMTLTGYFVLPNESAYPYEDTPSTNDPYALTFDAFRKHQVWLDVEADPKLAEIDNVYSRNERDAVEDLEALWDYAYYEGRWYCYFGPTPVVLYYMPYYAIHHLLPTIDMPIRFFGTLGILFLCLAVLALVRMTAPRTPLPLVLLAMPTAASLSGAWWMMDMGGRYCVATAAGLCFLSLCLWTGMEAVMTRRLPLRMVLLAVSGAAMAACAGARPPMVLCAAVLVPLFIGLLLERRTRLPLRLAEAACFLVPAAAGAAALMWYNAARFGDPLQFGAVYQITVNDVHANRLRLTDLGTALWHYFCLLPASRPTFPHIEGEWGYLENYRHYVYLEGAVGWLSYAAVTLALLYLPRVLRSPDGRLHGTARWQRRAVLLVGLGMAVLLAWLDFSMGGVNQRYLYDLAPLLVLVCLPVLLRMSRATTGGVTCGRYTALAFVLSMLLAWILLIGVRGGTLLLHCPQLYTTLEQAFGF